MFHAIGLHFHCFTMLLNLWTWLVIEDGCGVPHSTVWEILHGQQLNPYHPKRVHAMGPADFALRVNFCMWFLHRCVEEPQFSRQIVFTDECRFTRGAILNSRNSHAWDDENTYAQHALGFRQCFGIKVWAGIVDGLLIGPYLLPPRLTGHTYLPGRSIWWIIGRCVIEHPSTPLVSTRWRTTPFYRCSSWSTDHLNRCYEQRWIDRGNPIVWPQRSPDLSSLDFFCGAIWDLWCIRTLWTLWKIYLHEFWALHKRFNRHQV